MAKPGYWSGAMLLVLVWAGCSDFETGYFRERVNEVSIEQVVKRYGPPHKAEKLDGGRQTWTYFDRGSGTSGYSGMARSTYCRAYVLVFDQEDVLREWRQQECRH